MRKIVANLFISLDGVVEAPEQWHFPYATDEMNEIIGAQAATAGALLLGRRTFEEFAAFWPHQGADNPMAAVLNSAPKLVASTTLPSAEVWANSTLVSGDVAAKLEQERRKDPDGGDISIIGSPTLVRSLLAAGSLDELRLLLHPIVVGSGARLFDVGARVPLALLDSRPIDSGVLYLTYGRAA